MRRTAERFRKTMGLVCILACLMPVSTALSDTASIRGNKGWLDNGVMKLGIDTAFGGSITYLSHADSSTNLVNIYDHGRLIQQSYYAGQSLDRRSEGQRSSWSPWPWNPIQGGNAAGLSSVSLMMASLDDGTTLYSETHPRLWDMNYEFGQASMQQWMRFESGMNNVVRVENRLICWRNADDIWGEPVYRHQECPAVYLIRDMGKVVLYDGSSPWQNNPLTVVTSHSGPPWHKYYPTENWAACVYPSNNFGVGIYTTYGNQFWYVGSFGSSSGGSQSSSTMHLAPIHGRSLAHNTIWYYTYWIILGDVDTIRARAYQLKNNPPPASPAVRFDWTGAVDNNYANAANRQVAGSSATFLPGRSSSLGADSEWIGSISGPANVQYNYDNRAHPSSGSMYVAHNYNAEVTMLGGYFVRNNHSYIGFGKTAQWRHHGGIFNAENHQIQLGRTSKGFLEITNGQIRASVLNVGVNVQGSTQGEGEILVQGGKITVGALTLGHSGIAAATVENGTLEVGSNAIVKNNSRLTVTGGAVTIGSNLGIEDTSDVVLEGGTLDAATLTFGGGGYMGLAGGLLKITAMTASEIGSLIAAEQLRSTQAGYKVLYEDQGGGVFRIFTELDDSMSDPQVITHPKGLTVEAGASAQFSITAADAEIYQWYKDGVALMPSAAYSGQNTNTLTLHSVQVANEGFYYCVASNTLGPSAASEQAQLLIRRLVGWWKLDGNLTDSVATVVPGAPTFHGASVNPIFVAGIDGNALAFDGTLDRVVVVPGSSDFYNFYPRGYTVSVWVKVPESTNPGYLGGKTFPAAVVADRRGFHLQHSVGGDAVHFLRQSFNNISAGVNIYGDQWHLITGTYDPVAGSGRIYVDGVLQLARSSSVIPDPAQGDVRFGADGSLTEGVPNLPLIGQLDDVRIYSYPLDPVEIAYLYAHFRPGERVCVEYPTFDVSGPEGIPDCIVNFYDFAELAAQWLKCNRIPDCL